MSKKERACLIGEILDRHFPNPEIPLQHRDAYTLLVAVLLSAQCNDARVNQVTPALFQLADTPEKMAVINSQTIEKIVRPCGLAPTKARAIQKLSQMIVEEFEGKVPNSFSDLEKLPGVGHKTASVVMAQAFHAPAFPVDTHIHRCAHRWGLSSGKSVEKTERDLKRLFPKNSWIKRHLQIVLFARKFCPARGHKPEKCPICSQIHPIDGCYTAPFRRAMVSFKL